jgi:hypothetical protein
MAQPTTEPGRVTAFLELSQQLQTQVSDRSFRITPPSTRAGAQALAVVDHNCATGRRALRLTAAVLGVAAFAALGGRAHCVLHRDGPRPPADFETNDKALVAELKLAGEAATLAIT